MRFDNQQTTFARTTMQAEICRMNAQFLWRLDDLPKKGTYVWAMHNNQPIRWSYLPQGATHLDVEKDFTNGRRWNKTVSCQATIMKDGKMIDYWRFTVRPTAETHVG